EPVDRTSAIGALLDAAPGLPHPALEAAARGHARFLADLADRRDLLRREVLVVLRHRLHSNGAGDDPAGRLHRRANEAAAALAAAGVTLAIADGPAAAACLARALDPAGTTRIAGLDGHAATDEPVTLAHPGTSHPDPKGHR
ncbi:MAG: PrgI family protein, partial [Candidatus Dormibacteria bacterium]